MSKLDADIHQIFKDMINEDQMSLKVDPQFSGEINIELNADDGDSVQVRPMCGEVLSISPGQVVDVSKARSIFISANQSMDQLMVSLDGQVWHELQGAASFYNVNSSFKLIKVQANESSILKLLMKG